MNHFDAHLMVSSREVDSITQDGNLYSIFMRKMQNANVMLEISRFFFGTCSDLLLFKVRVFVNDFEFLIGVQMNRPISSRHSNSNFAHHIVIKLITLQGVN